MNRSLNQRFWISAGLGAVVVAMYSIVMWGMLIPIKPLLFNKWVLSISLLAVMALGMNLFFWVFIRWNGCLGRTGVLRLTLLFAVLTQIPSGLGSFIWLGLPIKAILETVIQGVSEVIVIGLIASLFMNSRTCSFSPKQKQAS